MDGHLAGEEENLLSLLGIEPACSVGTVPTELSRPFKSVGTLGSDPPTVLISGALAIAILLPPHQFGLKRPV